jgi:cyclohexadienyl dehydratase
MLRLAQAMSLSLLMAGCVSPSPSPRTVESRVIRFGLTADYPPFAYRRTDGALAGADVVIAKRVARMLGARAEFEVTTWQTLAADFSADRFDIAIGGLTVTPEREALGVFSRALLQDGKRPLARCAEKRRYVTIAQIDQTGVRVMTTAGPGIAMLAQKWFSHATIFVRSDAYPFAAALLDGSVDVWVTDGVVVDQMARRFPNKLCATTTTPFTTVTKAWLIRRDARLVTGVDGALRILQRQGAWTAAVHAVP